MADDQATTDLENLQRARSKAIAKLAELDTLYLDFPNAPGEVDYDGHRRALMETIERLNGLIAQAGGDWEIAYEQDT